MLDLKQSNGGAEPDWENLLGHLEVTVNAEGGAAELKRQKIKSFGPETAHKTLVDVNGRDVSVADMFGDRKLLWEFRRDKDSTAAQMGFITTVTFLLSSLTPALASLS